MNEDEKQNYRLFLFKEFNNSSKKQMHQLSLKLIQNESIGCIVKNEKNIFKDNYLKSIKDMVLKYNNKDFPTDILTRLFQFFSINESNTYKINILSFSYSLYLHSISSGVIESHTAFKYVLDSIPFSEINCFRSDLKLNLQLPNKKH